MKESITAPPRDRPSDYRLCTFQTPQHASPAYVTNCDRPQPYHRNLQYRLRTRLTERAKWRAAAGGPPIGPLLLPPGVFPTLWCMQPSSSTARTVDRRTIGEGKRACQQPPVPGFFWYPCNQPYADARKPRAYAHVHASSLRFQMSTAPPHRLSRCLPYHRALPVHAPAMYATTAASPPHLLLPHRYHHQSVFSSFPHALPPPSDAAFGTAASPPSSFLPSDFLHCTPRCNPQYGIYLQAYLFLPNENPHLSVLSPFPQASSSTAAAIHTPTGGGRASSPRLKGKGKQ
ncbi:hypothetical protein Agub_g13222 [Astrephomene gubernaculifera]|uniref:Uncharacterized protein n=1 Tax=Astrephomene gubernaculifera TaxID=47775 RepID=A0AAD3DJ12_9CHLO|nr:hypothetical protein Agub_g3657 [Astrephomene gubernaculifera]GFR51049.1 hypothetical protein Agub_g13222 [Astrephomene gubernaculifera]